MQPDSSQEMQSSYFGISLREGATLYNIAVMVLVVFMLQVLFQLWSIIIPRYLMEVAHLSRAHLGKVTGSMGITYDIIRVLFIGVFGALADRFGRKTILLLGAIVSAVCYFYFAFAGKLSIMLGINLVILLFAARIVIALSMQMMTPQLLPTFFDYSLPRCRGRIAAVFGFTMSLGAFLAYRILGPLSKKLTIDEFVMLGSWISLAVFILVLIGVVDLTPGRDKVTLKWKSIWDTIKRSFRNIKEAWPIVRKKPALMFCYGVAFVEKSDIAVQVTFFFAWCVAVARQFSMTRGEATAEAAAVVSWGAVMSLLVYAISGFIVDRFGRKFVLMAGLLISGLGFVFLGFLDNPFTLLAVMAVGARGFGTGAATLGSQTLVSDLAPKELLGTIMGGFYMAAAVGMMVVVALSIYLFDYVGFSYPFALAGGMDLVIFIWGVCIWKKIPETRNRPKRVRPFP